MGCIRGVEVGDVESGSGDVEVVIQHFFSFSALSIIFFGENRDEMVFGGIRDVFFF